MEEEHFRFEVTQEDKGKRLDKFLVDHLPKGPSRSLIQKLIADSHVTVNGKSAKSHHKLHDKDAIGVTVPPPGESSVKAEEIPIEIVYEDESLLVVNKSADMVVHPAPGNYSGTLVNALLARCKDLSGIGGILKPGIVHRIDKGTSGLLVVAKTDHVHKDLARQFKDKTIKRVYIALVKGLVDLDNGIIELPIARSRRDRKKMAVDFNEEKTAVTRYHVIERFKYTTLLELTLGTGKTHQIRVHMSYMDHPLVGDDKYGTRGEFVRPALHAATLGFVHPVSKKYMEFTSELPSDMKELIDTQRL